MDILSIYPVDYHKLDENALRVIVQRSDIPSRQRAAARELYMRGDRDFSIDFIIHQMNLYKDYSIPENTKRETCMAAAVELGRLKDERAIEPLFDALGKVSQSGAAYGLAKINGERVKQRLLKMCSVENEEGIHAAIALGFMKNTTVVPTLVHLLELKKEYKEKYSSNIAFDSYDYYIFLILGTYPNNELAAITFLKHLTNVEIGLIMTGFVSQERGHEYFIRSIEILKDNPLYVISSTDEELKQLPRYVEYPIEQEWEIAKKNGWDKYLDTEEKLFSFSGYDVSRWETLYHVHCPFESDQEIYKLRQDVVQKILKATTENAS